jgi:hypothetical protein
VRWVAVCLLLVVLVAGCGGGGSKRISEDHATQVGIDVGNQSVTFTFDVAPDSVKQGYAAGESLAECGSGRPVRPDGRAFYVVHFSPAQTQGVPYRILTRPGPVREAAKICDFEADVGWVIGLDTRLPADVSRHGSTVTVTFGG